MTVRELIEALMAFGPNSLVVLSGDSDILGDGTTQAPVPSMAPAANSVSREPGGPVVIWPDCSWDEAFEHWKEKASAT